TSSAFWKAKSSRPSRNSQAPCSIPTRPPASFRSACRSSSPPWRTSPPPSPRSAQAWTAFASSASNCSRCKRVRRGSVGRGTARVLFFRRKLPRQQKITDPPTQELIHQHERPREPRHQRFALALDDEPDDPVDDLLDRPDAEGGRGRLGPRLSVRAEHVVA